MFKCLDCGNTKFHMVSYYCFRMPQGIPEVIETDTEVRCVICHRSYLLSEISSKTVEVENGSPVNSDGHETEENAGGRETAGGTTKKRN